MSVTSLTGLQWENSFGRRITFHLFLSAGKVRAQQDRSSPPSLHPRGPSPQAREPRQLSRRHKGKCTVALCVLQRVYLEDGVGSIMARLSFNFCLMVKSSHVHLVLFNNHLMSNHYVPGTVLGTLDVIEQSTGIFTQSSAGTPSLKTVGRKMVCVVNEGRGHFLVQDDLLWHFLALGV